MFTFCKRLITLDGAGDGLLDAEALQSKTIDYLRFPMALAVVFIHSAGDVPMSQVHYDAFTGLDFYNLLRIVFSHVLTHIAVPVFYVISGYLYFLNVKQWSWNEYKRKSRSRLYTLVIPYLLWNVAALLLFGGWSVVKHYMASHVWDFSLFLEQMRGLSWLWNVNEWGANRTNWLGYTVPMTGPINLPLWFLRDLIVVSALSPLVYYWVRYTRKWGLLLLALCYVSNVFPLIQGLRVSAVLFFTLGAYFSINKRNMVMSLRRIEGVLALLTIILVPVVVYYDGVNTHVGSLIYPFYVLSATLFAFCCASRMVQRGCRPNAFLTRSCFFVYAVHSVVIVPISMKILALVFGNSSWLSFSVVYMLSPFLTVLMCVLLYALMLRCFPILASWLTGKR